MAAMQQVERTPGLVRGGTLHHIDVGFKYTGNDKAERKITKKNFEPLLGAILKGAGFGGTFTIVVGTYVKGTPHTRGLRIKSPTRLGLEITWHEGDNSNCLGMVVRVPPPMDPITFHSKLKAAEAAFDAEEQAQRELGRAAKNGNGSGNGQAFVHVAGPTPAKPRILPDLRAASHASPQPVDMSQPAKAATPTSQQEAQGPGPSPEPFVHDEINIELFMSEIAKSASPKGWVRVSVCASALRQHFNYRRGGQGSVLRSLVSRGHMSRVDNENFCLSKSWFQKLRPELVSSHEVSVSSSRQSADTPSTQKPAETLVPRTPSTSAALTPGQQIDRLATQVRKAQTRRARRQELAQEEASLASLIEMNTNRLNAVREEIGRLDEFLNSPETKTAEERFARISAALED